MPLYQYKCKDCNKLYEEFVSLRIDGEGVDHTIHPKCPACEGQGTKQLSPISFKVNGYSEKNGYS